MGWKAPTGPAIEVGVIPHKKVVTEKELENLRRNAPEFAFDVDSVMKENAEVFRSRAQERIDNFEEVETFYNTWKEELHQNDKIHLPVLEMEDFDKQLEDRLESEGSVLDFDDVFDVALLELRPNYFYFSVTTDDQVDMIAVAITSIPYWEQHHAWDDRDFAERLVPEWLSKLTDCQYEVCGDMTPAEVRKALTKAGFIEKNEIAKPLDDGEEIMEF